MGAAKDVGAVEPWPAARSSSAWRCESTAAHGASAEGGWAPARLCRIQHNRLKTSHGAYRGSWSPPFRRPLKQRVSVRRTAPARGGGWAWRQGPFRGAAPARHSLPAVGRRSGDSAGRSSTISFAQPL